jgi:hypothetical protein
MSTLYTIKVYDVYSVRLHEGMVIIPMNHRTIISTGSFPITVDQLISQSYLVGPNNAEILAQYQRAIDSLNSPHVSVYPPERSGLLLTWIKAITL